MQITVRSPEVPEVPVVLTLRLDLTPSLTCGICESNRPDWFDDPASDSAMNPAASPLGEPFICSSCLNFLLEVGTLEVTELDPRSF